MKQIFFPLYFICLLLTLSLSAQDSMKLKDLAVPNSPAFILTDGTFSLVQSPNIPKSFVLGIAQSFQQSSSGFPQDYSAEFTPYWWLGSTNRDVFTMMGLKTKREGGTIKSVYGEDPFSGLKFTSVSLAFLNKDLIPDTFKNPHKIVSLGIRTTLVKVHLKNYVTDLHEKLTVWEKIASNDISMEEQIAAAQSDSVQREAAYEKIKTKLKKSRALNVVKEINAIMEQKPIFSWDLAAAYASYGINDSIWKPGRYGVWTTLSSYVPLDLGGEKPSKNYFNFNLSLRYLHDNYQMNDKGVISANSSIDVGFKLALELDKFSVGVESLRRHRNGIADSQNRTVGIINYKVAENIYLNGVFGKNFDVPNRLISQFGINWGFGSEKAGVPSQ